MRKYEIILLDLDDTLLDFQTTEYEALSNLFAEEGIPLTDAARARYHQINSDLWANFEKGIMDRNTVVNTRFQLLFQELGKQVDGKALEQKYRQFLNDGAHMIEGAASLCKALSFHHDLYLATNGVLETQEKRLKKSGLDQFFKKIYVSESIGFHKPQLQFYQSIFQDLKRKDLSNVIMIGDSLSSDIAGGISAGIDTCWFNPSRKANTSLLSPTYEVHSLDEISDLLSCKKSKV